MIDPPDNLVSEHTVVTTTRQPATVTSLISDLELLGIRGGDVIIVHSSLSSLGWVIGGAQAVVEALLEVVGESGTIVMPTHSSHLTEPAHWENPSVPEAWWPEIYAAIPAFDTDLTPTTKMGAIVECFRHVPGIVRSNHPWASFAATGPEAAFITADHRLEEGMGEHSPLGKLYKLDAKVLLLGVGHANNSSLHLCEHRANWLGRRQEQQGSAIMVDGQRTWVTYEHLVTDSDDFDQIGVAFDPGRSTIGSVGSGPAKAMNQRQLVDFGVTWMNTYRPGSLPA